MRFIVLGGLLLLVSAGQARADGFYCGSRLVKQGDSDAAVLAKCGEPDSRAPVVETQCLAPGWCQTVQVGERWTYDFGPQQFMRHLTFRNQRLYRVEAGEYGHRAR